MNCVDQSSTKRFDYPALLPSALRVLVVSFQRGPLLALLVSCLSFCTISFVAAHEPAIVPLRQAHAHNDYLHTRPLLDALDQGFGSVEADIFLKDGQLLIGHEAKDLQPSRTLESLYLQPLRDRIQTHQGSVYGKEFQFYLLIDVKTAPEETYEVLDQTLRRHAEMLSVWRNDRFEPKAVTVILSGNRARELIAKQPLRYVAIDGRPDDLDTDVTAHLVPWISARWGQLFTWNGDGPFPASEQEKLIDLVSRAHKRGQQVRFWATPEKETVWKELLNQQVDLINTDDLAGLRRFLLANAKPKLGANEINPKQGSQTLVLLDKLRRQNSGEDRFKDPWCQTLKEIVDLGPDAVPQLIEELDQTNDDMMLRCLGFILRAIDDKRAVPALIRAIPRTLRGAGSDMGLRSDDPELFRFAQTHDLRDSKEESFYTFGRPVREICGALEKLTKTKHGEEDLYHVFLGGVPTQEQRKRVLFHRTAERWADWWEENWSHYLREDTYAKVNLRKIEDDDSAEPISPNSRFETKGGSSNWILESVRNPKAKRVFLDLDTGRVGRLPEKWRDKDEIDSHMDEILFWATREGFDLMGTEYQTPEGQSIYALRPIAMHVWELKKERWKMTSQDITLEELKAEGRLTNKWLLHHDEVTNAIVPQETASFLYITRHGTPGLLFVGIEVQDDNLKPGGVFNGDNELRPIAFYKGRRFGFTGFEIKR